MSRLTDKIINEKNIYVQRSIKQYGNLSTGEPLYTSIYTNKLGQLEDIEEELGIDLITLFKALKDGIYYKGRGTLKGYILYCNCPMLSFVHKTIETSLIEDYGKTWALDKKELEDNE